MSIGEHPDLLEALDAIDVETLSYQDWVNVGAALKHEGCDLYDWERWSSTDTRTKKNGASYYNQHECETKWRGFSDDHATLATAGTIYKLAKDAGWSPTREHRAYARDEAVTLEGGPVQGSARREKTTTQRVSSLPSPTFAVSDVTDEPFDMGEPRNPVAEFDRYLDALFKPDEHICYVTEARNDGEKWKPAGTGLYHQTRAQLEDAIDAEGLSRAMGGTNDESGVWICVNPTNGNGRSNSDITDYRYALVEDDTTEPEKQLAIYKALKLPYAALVWSGGRSVHAVVHVDASDAREYAERVRQLYDHCAKAGIDVDEVNKNPARLTRAPGFRRGDGWQRVISTTPEIKTWADWTAWLIEQEARLPEFESLSELMLDPPQVRPELIGGILRVGHKGLLTGDVKAGKTLELMNLARCVATGTDWLGHRCQRGKVLYINFEVDRASFVQRMLSICDAWGCRPQDASGISVWNLRGHAAPLDKLTPTMIERARGQDFALVIIDPIYKVLTGDENKASDMALFVNQFDRITEETGAAVMYAHHHTKGRQGQKRTMDRASGSGVFVRDPDAMLDMSQLSITDEQQRSYSDPEVAEWCRDWLAERDITVPDDLNAEALYGTVLKNADDKSKVEAARDGIWEKNRHVTAWRIESVLREFQDIDPIDLWFDYPRHLVDQTGVLAGAKVDAEETEHERGTMANRKAASERRKDRDRQIGEAIRACESDGVPATRANVLERWPPGAWKPSLATLTKATQGAKDGKASSSYRIIDLKTNELGIPEK